MLDANLTNGSAAAAAAVVLAPEPKPLISDAIREWSETILSVFIFIFGTLGVITNALNIRVFIYQGVTSDGSTIGLFSLATADFFSCLSLIPSLICDVMKYSPRPDLAFSCWSLFHVMFPIPHHAMAGLSSMITVYIAVERSVCVLAPFAVKRIFTPNVTSFFMVFMYVTTVCVYFPLLLNTSVEIGFSSSFNKTVAMYRETPAAQVIRNYMSLVLNTGISSVAIIVVAIATAMMLYKLNSIQKWREKSAFSGDGGKKGKEVATSGQAVESSQSKKDVEMLKIVTVVTGLFLFCLSMSHFPGFASLLVPGFSVTGFNQNIFIIFFWYKFVFDLINSSLNFFFYIRISSRYKKSFDEVFRKSSVK